MAGRQETLLTKIRGCRVCEAHLPHGPRPMLTASRSARLLVIGQAPGAKVHDGGIPWDDRSGERLREWLALDGALFYDADRVALVPTGFCYPGRGHRGGLPPRPECAPRWHGDLLERAADAADRHARTGALPRVSPKVDADRHRSGLDRVLSAVFCAPASLATQRHLARSTPLV